MLAETARVLRPGGRFAVSDVIADPDMDDATRADMAAFTGCIAGALTEDEFRDALAAAGLTDVEIRETHRVHEHAALGDRPRPQARGGCLTRLPIGRRGAVPWAMRALGVTRQPRQCPLSIDRSSAPAGHGVSHESRVVQIWSAVCVVCRPLVPALARMAFERPSPSVTVMPVRMLLVLFFASVVAACSSAGPRRTPVIVDTDLSSDDVIALLYVLQDPRVDLRAVTVSGTGLVHCPGGARIALDLLALGGRGDVPVACGSRIPLAGGNAPPEEWRRAADDLFGVTLPPSSRRAEPDAVRLLASAIQEAPAEPTVLELAPMTNLASVLKANRAVAARLHRIVAMSGAIDVDGNAPDQPRAEINVWSDPVAARAVLRSGAPVTLVPLDATNQVPVTTFVARALARYQYATPEATVAAEMVAATNMARGGSYFWDPLAAVAMTEPGLVRRSTRRLDVVTERRGGRAHPRR